VIAEIALFAFGAPLVARLGPAGLLILGGAAATLRWSVTAVASDLWLLLIVQALHGLTFGATHLGAMHYLARALPPDVSATGQALYAATVSGLGYGLFMAASGRLYAALGEGAYVAMAMLAGLGAVAAWRLGQLWHGERLAAFAPQPG